MSPRRVFVAGGAGGVGTGIVEAWLARDATVVTLSRNAERLEVLRRGAARLPGRLVVIEGSSSDPVLLNEIAAEHGPFDQVVASVGGGGWKLGPLRSIDPGMFERIVNDGIVAHWSVARSLRPHVVSGGTYIFINGGAAMGVIPGTGPLSLVAKAQLALAEIFAAEQPAKAPIRTVSLILTSPIKTPARGDRVEAEWLSPRDCGEACVHLHSHDNPPLEVIVGTRAEVEVLRNE